MPSASLRFVDGLRSVFEQHRNPKRASSMSAYMRNQFPFYGIGSVARTQLVASVYHDVGIPSPDETRSIARRLWKLPERELQYAAVDVMLRYKKHFTADDVELIEHLITHKSWWDTVDTLAPRVAGAIYAKHPKEVQEVVDAWIHSPNFWLNRSAIILQLSYKQHTDLALLERAIVPHLSSKEFFIQKAIGWALRQYSYVNAPWVVEFVHTHPLAPLSTREALKALRRQAERAHRTC
ncbi:MAG: hypothetical protein RL156_576 [Bacteroidota bacterium]